MSFKKDHLGIYLEQIFADWVLFLSSSQHCQARTLCFSPAITQKREETVTEIKVICTKVKQLLQQGVHLCSDSNSTILKQDAVGDGRFCPWCHLANWMKHTHYKWFWPTNSIMWKHDFMYKTGSTQHITLPSEENRAQADRHADRNTSSTYWVKVINWNSSLPARIPLTTIGRLVMDLSHVSVSHVRMGSRYALIRSISVRSAVVFSIFGNLKSTALIFQVHNRR